MNENLEFKFLEKGTILYHERECPFPNNGKFALFPYAWYQTKRGFWTNTSLEENNDDKSFWTWKPHWRYAYRTTTPIRLLDLSKYGDDPFTKIEDMLRRRIPEFPRAFAETYSDYPMTAGICQILGYNGYTWFDSLNSRSDDETHVVLCGNPGNSLEFIREDAIFMNSKAEEDKKREHCEETESKLTDVPMGQGTVKIPSTWANLSDKDITKFRLLDWSFLQ
jgi:hypothetical protein